MFLYDINKSRSIYIRRGPLPQIPPISSKPDEGPVRGQRGYSAIDQQSTRYNARKVTSQNLRYESIYLEEMIGRYCIS
jgi:hypothetical protein